MFSTPSRFLQTILLACQQVVLTPHNADQTPEGMELLNAGVVANVIAFLQGHARNRVV